MSYFNPSAVAFSAWPSLIFDGWRGTVHDYFSLNEKTLIIVLFLFFAKKRSKPGVPSNITFSICLSLTHPVFTSLHFSFLLYVFFPLFVVIFLCLFPCLAFFLFFHIIFLTVCIYFLFFSFILHFPASRQLSLFPPTLCCIRLWVMGYKLCALLSESLSI